MEAKEVIIMLNTIQIKNDSNDEEKSLEAEWQNALKVIYPEKKNATRTKNRRITSDRKP